MAILTGKHQEHSPWTRLFGFSIQDIHEVNNNAIINR